MNFLGVGVNIPGHSDEIVYLNSRKSIDDFDLVVVSTSIERYRYAYDEIVFSGGGRSLGIEGSKSLRDDITHWNHAISSYVSAGGVLFITLSSKEIFQIATGYTTPKANQRSYNTTSISNFELIPIDLKGVQNFDGESNALTFSGSGGTSFELPESLKQYFHYEVAFDVSSNGNIFYKNRNRTRALATYLKLGDGYIVLLPAFDFNVDELSETDKNGEEIWKNKAIGLGNQCIDYLKKIKKYLTSGSEITSPPAWVESEKYRTNTERVARKSINSNNAKIKKLEEANEQLHRDIEEASRLKGLLYETGKQLENSVTIALRALGYSAENYDDGELELDQIILSPEGERYIGECEGKEAKVINVTKFRQLNDSLAADFERDEVNEKARGIIFGNPSRLTPPKDRTEWFTQKALSGAKREKIALVKTPDLYVIAKYLHDNSDSSFAKKCREAISTTDSPVVKFPAIPKSEGNNQ